jgi:hypothetical protein
MKKSPTDRVKDSFSGDDRESIAKYVDWIRSAILDYSQALRRSATILVIAVVIFELAAYSKNQTITIGSFTITRNSVILVFLPAFVAYFFFQIVADQNRLNQLLDMYFEAASLWTPKGKENDIATPLLGSAPLYWNAFSGFYYKNNTYLSDKIEAAGSVVLMIFVLSGGVALEAQAYYVLFILKYPQIVLWAASLGVTVFCLVMGFAAIIASRKTP